MVGQTLAHYRVLEKIGQGGMGEVYLAEDTNLNRQVAIKVLPEQLAGYTESLARFEREAQLLAALNHSNIATIHGLEQSDGKRFIVMELVEGETLAERIQNGPLAVESALEVCKQIAEGLEAAHEKGVIHRDLKPANVKVTPDGKVKILDFGLAKAFEGETPASVLTQSPTLTEAATQAGILLGTAAYMSPEQAQGQPVDKRTDIFAFGALLYECLTGRRAFQGETITATLGAIIHKEPDWNLLPANVPSITRSLLRQCLKKDAHHRLRDIADARINIEEALSEPEAASAPAVVMVAQPLWKKALPWIVAGLIALVAAVGFWVLSRPIPQPITRVALNLTEPLGSSRAGANAVTVGLSPDGTRLVYVTPQGLYMRPMNSLQANFLSGTEGAVSAFFSPDGQWLGFDTNEEIKKVSVSGGAPITLARASTIRGANWGTDDTIIFGRLGAGLSQVSASGGTVTELTILDSETGEAGHVAPQILPGSKAVLFTLRGPAEAPGMDQIVVHSLETDERRVLVQGSYARYVSTGHLLYAQSQTPGTLLAVPFDVERLELTGSPVPVVQGVLQGAGSGVAQFSLSDLGTLVYVPGGSQSANLVWVDRQGVVEPLDAPAHNYRGPRLSPDGKRVTVEINEESTDIWVYDIERQTLTRLTFEGTNQQPLWMSDGERVTWRRTGSVGLGESGDLYWKLADGSAEAEPLFTSNLRANPTSWAPDGKYLAFYQRSVSAASSDTGRDIWILPIEGDREPQLFLQTPFNEAASVFSPDGKWLAYVSDESGSNEIYVRPFPGPGGKRQISTQGGVEPIWGQNGELFYRNETGTQFMAVDITTEPTFIAGTPKLLFEGFFNRSAGTLAYYDITPDGEKFLMVQQAQGAGANQINVVLNWFEELKQRVPAP